MNISAILSRIDTRCAEMGTSERAVSLVAGSADTIRNWRRAAQEGRQLSPRFNTLEAIAKALNTSVEYLINGEDDTAEPSTTIAQDSDRIGLQEAAKPFDIKARDVPDDAPDRLLRQIYGDVSSTPSSIRLLVDLPAFNLIAGDVVVVDLARLPVPGDLALVSIRDEEIASSVYGIYRYLPPFLSPGDTRNACNPMRIDQPGVTARAAVIGSIRGI